MPGGSPAAWPYVKPIFQSICAKVEDGSPCCDWVGENGAGHFVKMVHNGIEYGDMQLICEAYQLMRDGLGLTCDEMHEVFSAAILLRSLQISSAIKKKTALSPLTGFLTAQARRAQANGQAFPHWTKAFPSR